MKNLYLQIVGLVLSLVLVLGFALPWLFSAESDIAVILGVIVAVAYGYALLVYVPKIIRYAIALTKKPSVDEKK